MGAGFVAALPGLHKRGLYAVCATTRYDRREPCPGDWRSLPLRGRFKLHEASGARAQTHAADQLLRCFASNRKHHHILTHNLTSRNCAGRHGLGGDLENAAMG